MIGKKVASLFARFFLLAGATLLASCGGGSAGDGKVQIGGINGGGRGVASGAITGFGSIFVNGVEYRTGSAQITINGQPGTESQLRVGHVVAVRGTLDKGGTAGSAETVSFDDNVSGPIESIDLAAATFIVLGQTVRTDGATTFDNSSIQPAELATLKAGESVEVSGFVTSTGAIVATRIARNSGGSRIEVTGSAANLDTNAMRFQVNALVVDYSMAQLTNGAPTNGACVEVRGDSTGLSGGVLRATRVEVKSCQQSVANGDLGEIEGLITTFRTASDFDVAGRRVSTTGATVFVGGSAVNLAVNVKVEAEGTFDSAATLIASTVRIKKASELRVTGTIDSLNAASSMFTVLGVTITTDSFSRFEDSSSQRASPFNFSSLRAGDYVEVRGISAAAPNSLVATILERKDLNTKRDLQGVAGNLAAPVFTILGVSVVTDAGTSFKDESDSDITSAVFFAAADGRLVKATGNWNGSSLAATIVEIENP